MACQTPALPTTHFKRRDPRGGALHECQSTRPSKVRCAGGVELGSTTSRLLLSERFSVLAPLLVHSATYAVPRRRRLLFVAQPVASADDEENKHLLDIRLGRRRGGRGCPVAYTFPATQQQPHQVSSRRRVLILFWHTSSNFVAVPDPHPHAPALHRSPSKAVDRAELLSPVSTLAWIAAEP